MKKADKQQLMYSKIAVIGFVQDRRLKGQRTLHMLIDSFLRALWKKPIRTHQGEGLLHAWALKCEQESTNEQHKGQGVCSGSRFKSAVRHGEVKVLEAAGNVSFIIRQQRE